jgi:hypothetical protein
MDQNEKKGKGEMSTDQITPGTKIGHWLVARAEGRSALCQCVCGATRFIAIAALLDGSASPSCGCAPRSREEIDAARGEIEDRERRREQRKWRPGGASFRPIDLFLTTYPSEHNTAGWYDPAGGRWLFHTAFAGRYFFDALKEMTFRQIVDEVARTARHEDH